ncbi:MAG: (E)-4-hydroxy-3-methylbut-2-enyl-diphosphate synthase [Bacteroidales bacterium]|nr:(E)-4-hydroxy-3-methylbut-2-enyl-diphosphate synthase [Bacteroidales bacterium]
MERISTIPVRIGGSLVIGGGAPVAVQTMCSTHTSDEEATVAQCRRLAGAGAELIRITVPGMSDVEHISNIRKALRAEGILVPIVADIHFSAQTALAVAPHVEKVRINPGNFHPDHDSARRLFAELLKVCRDDGTAIRIGLNHGSLGRFITERFGNTPEAMAEAAMEWLKMCVDNDFKAVVVSLKASNTAIMTAAYRLLSARMQEDFGFRFPLHVGVTEAGGGESGRIKSAVGIGTLLGEGIGDTIRVSLTEDPEAEIPVGRAIADYFAKGPDSIAGDFPELKAALDWGPGLLRHDIDTIPAGAVSEHLEDEIMQAARRRFYRAEFVACPGCGRTMYDLQGTFEAIRERTSHLKGTVIAVMGCIVNGPGEMADADWGYVGEGDGKVTIYRRNVPVLRHIPDTEAIDRLVSLIEEEQRRSPLP